MAKILSLLLGLFLIISGTGKDRFEITLKPEPGSLMTRAIQDAIDQCSGKGGGIVRFTPGTYNSGTIELRDNITLVLEEGALLKGSDSYTDYRNDAFIYGKDLKGIGIQGSGEIDGVNCYNPKGEEGFRGPHCLKFINCSNLEFTDFTIRNSANWAINCRYCSFGNVTNVTILGGHDGLHTRFCNNFRVTGCDFRTGDDAFAGNDNRDFYISNCLVNTSCNGFRMGCMNLTVRRCTLWGPGEYMHKIQKRTNMLSAFVHFSPGDEKPKLQSGNWVIEDITVRNVDKFYIYNYKTGLWQTGQPVTTLLFRNVAATGILTAFYLSGDSEKQLEVSIENSSFNFREGSDNNMDSFEGGRLISNKFFYAGDFGLIALKKVTFGKQDSAEIMLLEHGNETIMNNVTFNTGSELQPFRVNNIDNAELKKVFLDDIDITGKKLSYSH